MFPFSVQNLLQISVKNPRCHILKFRCHRNYCGVPDTGKVASPLVDYFKNLCGLSAVQALAASKTLLSRKSLLKDLDGLLSLLMSNFNRPQSVRMVLEDNGFSKTNIAAIITTRPDLLLFRKSQTLIPKLKFLEEQGLSKSQIVELVSGNPRVLVASLDMRIKPLFAFLHTLPVSNDNIVDIISHYYGLLTYNWEKSLVPNVNLLRKHEVPSRRILDMLLTHPKILMLNSDRFCDNLEMIVGMGFNSSTHQFMKAVRAMATISKSSWKAKSELYKSLGWSDSDISFVFRKNPSSFLISEEKVRKAMDFFTKELSWDPSRCSQYPALLLLSLEKRILPRYMILQALESKGLVKKRGRYVHSFLISEKIFFDTYIAKYGKEFPELLKIYQAGFVLKSENNAFSR
ncbi:transcription termination factor MTERF5, chloroplastic-like [Aristolochia californica]|uniref:transcription termination factor MTERF5, chloroplastic-like n=1 Tax=Aristolochia californica TaxID=171875 RepID=UPI0035E17258